jgi:hypothetical protein
MRKFVICLFVYLFALIENKSTTIEYSPSNSCYHLSGENLGKHYKPGEMEAGKSEVIVGEER